MDMSNLRLAVALEKVDGIVMLPMQAHQKTVKPYSCIDLRLDALSKEERDDVLVRVARNPMIYVRTTDDGEVLDSGVGDGGPDGLGEVLMKLDEVMKKVEKMDEGVEKLNKLDVEKPDDSEACGLEARKYIILCVFLFAGGYALGRCGADLRCQFVTGNQAIKEFFTPAIKSGFEVFRKEVGRQLLSKLSLS